MLCDTVWLFGSFQFQLIIFISFCACVCVYAIYHPVLFCIPLLCKDSALSDGWVDGDREWERGEGGQSEWISEWVNEWFVHFHHLWPESDFDCPQYTNTCIFIIFIIEEEYRVVARWPLWSHLCRPHLVTLFSWIEFTQERNTNKRTMI